MKWPVPEDFADWMEWGRKLILALKEADPDEKKIADDVLVTAKFTAPNAATLITHGLDADLAGGLPNVLWEVVAIRHSGSGTGAVSVEFQAGDAVNRNAIDLRVRNVGRAIAPGANEITFVLRFKKWVPW